MSQLNTSITFSYWVFYFKLSLPNVALNSWMCAAVLQFDHSVASCRVYILLSCYCLFRYIRRVYVFAKKKWWIKCFACVYVNHSKQLLMWPFCKDTIVSANSFNVPAVCSHQLIFNLNHYFTLDKVYELNRSISSH